MITFETTNTGGWGSTSRGTKGDHKVFESGYITLITEAIHTEAQACLTGVQFVLEAGTLKLE